jgi:SAM-dependent methyltransferase
MMLQKTGERQVATVLDGIRLDHRVRYEWAAGLVRSDDSVLDVGCGVGYGSTLLATNAKLVQGVDVDEETIAYARKYWARDRVIFEVADASALSLSDSNKFDFVVMFEVVEHLVMPELYLRSLHGALSENATLLLSVPNEPVVQHTIDLNPFHIRHYTPDELRQLIASSGYVVEELFSQNEDFVSEKETGRTLIAKCRRDPSFCVCAVSPDEWKVALHKVGRELVERGNVIRKLQKEGRRAAERIDRQDAEIRRATIREDASQMIIRRTSVDLHDVRSEASKAQSTITRLREVQMETERALSEAAAVLKMQNSELQRLKEELEMRSSELRRQKEDHEKKLRAQLEKQNSELQRLKEDQEKKLRAQLKFFNPQRPTVASLWRLCVRYRFFAPIVAMAPLNSIYSVYKKALKARTQKVAR